MAGVLCGVTTDYHTSTTQKGHRDGSQLLDHKVCLTPVCMYLIPFLWDAGLQAPQEVKIGLPIMFNKLKPSTVSCEADHVVGHAEQDWPLHSSAAHS